MVFWRCQKVSGGVNRINGKIDEQIEGQKRYADSQGYEKDIAKIEQMRATEIAALRDDCRDSFNRCLAAMQKNAQARPAVAPTQEQLAILQVLKMKERVTRDALAHAAISMGDCGLALDVLQELARKHEILGFHASTGVSDSFVLDSIRAFAKSARITLSLDRTNQRRELLSGNEGPHGTLPPFENIAKFRLDVAPRKRSRMRCQMEWSAGAALRGFLQGHRRRRTIRQPEGPGVFPGLFLRLLFPTYWEHSVFL